MSGQDNDIQFNLENDQDKDYRVTVYLNKEERDALEKYRNRKDQTISDAAGELIVLGLRRQPELPFAYRRGEAHPFA